MPPGASRAKALRDASGNSDSRCQPMLPPDPAVSPLEGGSDPGFDRVQASAETVSASAGTSNSSAV